VWVDNWIHLAQYSVSQRDYCTSQSYVFPQWFWSSYTDSFSRIWKMQQLTNTDYTVLILTNAVLFLCVELADLRPMQINGVVLSISWWLWPEILRRILTVKNAYILRLCCLLSNPMQYSAWDVWIYKVKYKLVSLKKQPLPGSQNAWHWSKF
jgi:hypothetical protein